MATKMDERGAQQKDLDLQIKRLQKNLEQMVKEKEELHRKKLLTLYEERDNIIDAKKNYEHERNSDLSTANDEFESKMLVSENLYNDEKDKIIQQSQQAMFNLKTDQKNFQEALQQAEEDYNEDLKTTIEKLEGKLSLIKEKGEQLRQRNSKLDKENEKNKERKQKLEDLMQETKEQNQKLELEINEFESKCLDMQSQLDTQEEIINEREDTIKQFRNMNYHLQNYKSVYDYQVNTLKGEQEPLNQYSTNLEVGKKQQQ